MKVIRKYWNDSEEKLITCVVLSIPSLIRFLPISFLFFCFIIGIDILVYVFFDKIYKEREIENKARKRLLYNLCNSFFKWVFIILFFRIVEGKFYSIKFYSGASCIIIIVIMLDFYIRTKKEKKEKK